MPKTVFYQLQHVQDERSLTVLLISANVQLHHPSGMVNLASTVNIMRTGLLKKKDVWYVALIAIGMLFSKHASDALKILLMIQFPINVLPQLKNVQVGNS